MKISSNDMYVNGEYLKNNPAWGIGDAKWKAAVISGLIKSNNLQVEKIIEVGCGVGGILEQLSANDSVKTLTGYDISPQAISRAKSRQSEKLTFKNQDFLAASQETSDLLLVIDVFEHVDNYYQFLRDLQHRSKYFIFHIPLDLCCRTLLKPHVLLQQRNAVGHIHYFSKEMVLWFLSDTGYQVVDWVYTKPIIDTDPPDSFKRRVKKILRNFSYSINKEISSKLWGGYSMMILANKP